MDNYPPIAETKQPYLPSRSREPYTQEAPYKPQPAPKARNPLLSAKVLSTSPLASDGGHKPVSERSLIALSIRCLPRVPFRALVLVIRVPSCLGPYCRELPIIGFKGCVHSWGFSRVLGWFLERGWDALGPPYSYSVFCMFLLVIVGENPLNLD